MSPVIKKVSSSCVPAAYPFHLTAVSKVLGKLFSNKRKRSGSLMVVFRRAIVLSTSGKEKVRQFGVGRWYESWYCPLEYGP